MTTLLLGDGEATAHALTATLALGGDVHLLDLATLPPLAEPLAELVGSLAPAYDAIVAPATSTGKSVLPRVAALLDVMQISEVVEVLAPDTFKRPTYAGNAIETVQSTDIKKVLTVRASAFPATSLDRATLLPAPTVPAAAASTFISRRSTESAGPELGSARIVVSGGRAFGSKEKFDELLVPLAAKLDAAIGASRAAVDSGYAANDLQVGQTGKIVAPDLYIACGISGAIQHLAGMKSAKVIVAINSDPAAPIFAIADYGLVGDLFTLLPELTAAL
ncbi:MAG TPA: FAD-binding protein [Devosia sp.]|nr:FAD-binding protein [Devosia sp.]